MGTVLGRVRTVLIRLTVLGVFLAAAHATGDETLYRYEGDVHPLDPSAGWVEFDPCEPPCADAVEDGHFVVRWAELGERFNYHFWIAQPDDPPPPDTLWVEWQFRSNHPIGPNFPGCDGGFWVRYAGISQPLHINGDAAITPTGSGVIFGLELNEFHTYRFESPDGVNYRLSVDGTVFLVDSDDTPDGFHFLQLNGANDCLGDFLEGKSDHWDFVRYGSLDSGEQIIATDPPAGFVDPAKYPNIDRFTVTFDSANYVYIDEITVEVTGGDVPVVTQTWRRDGDGPETLEIVLDRPMTIAQTTKFTFNDGTAVNVVEFTLRSGPVPTVSHWGLAALTLLLLTAASVKLRQRTTQAVP